MSTLKGEGPCTVCLSVPVSGAVPKRGRRLTPHTPVSHLTGHRGEIPELSEMQKKNKELVKLHLFPAWLETQHLYPSDSELVLPCLRMKSGPFKESPLLKTHLLEEYLALLILLKRYKLQMI